MNAKKLLFAIASTLALSFTLSLLAVKVGRSAGESAAQESQKRLLPLWPHLLELPEQDRALLALLALECRLPEQPHGRAATVSCLRSATGSEGLRGISSDPAGQLEKLLNQARPEAVNGEQG